MTGLIAVLKALRGFLAGIALLTGALVCQEARAAPPFFQAAGAAQSGTGAVSPAWPAHDVGDIALLFVETRGNQAANLTTAAGFASLGQSNTGGTGGTRLTVFWARATSSAMASPTVGDAGDHVHAQILTYRGVISAGNPWGTDTSIIGTKGTASTTVTVTGITTDVPEALVVQAVSRSNDSAAAAFSNVVNGNLSGIGIRVDGGTTAGNGGGFAVWDGVKTTAGASGDTTADINVSVVNAFRTIALWPADLVYYSRIVGNWGTAATWSNAGCGGISAAQAPPAGSRVVVCNGDTVTVNTDTAAILELTIQNGGVVTIGNSATARTITVTGDIANAGTLQVNTGSNTTHTLNVGGNVVNTGTFDLATDANSLCSTNWTGGGSHTITGSAAMTFHDVAVANDLIVNKAGGPITQSGTLTVDGSLTLQAGTLNLENATTVAGATSISGALNHSTGTGARIFTGAVTIDPGGTWSNTGGAGVEFRGNFDNQGTFTAGAGTYAFNGAAAQSITGAVAGTAFGSLTVNNANGVVLSGSHSVTVSTLLTLTNGVLATGANVIYASAACPASVARTNGWVAGNLRLRTPAAGNATCVFPVGDPSSYRPVSVSFTTLSAAGDVTAAAGQSAIDSPNIGASTFDAAFTANRYWTVTNSTAAFTSATATFTYGADLDAGADEAAFVVGRFNAGWSYLTTVTGSGSAQATALTAATLTGEFQVGEQAFSAFASWRMDQYSWNGTTNEVIDSGAGGGGPFHGTAAGLAVTKPTTSAGSPAIAGSPGTCQYGVFDRNNKDYVAVAAGFPNLTASTGSFTIAAWIRTTANNLSGQRIVVDDESNATPGGWAFSLGDGGAGALRFFYRDGATLILDTPGVVASNTWVYVAAVVSLAAGANASRVTLYAYSAGGAQLTATTTTFTWNAGGDAGPLAIGGETNASGENNSNFGFSGNIDEVRVVRSALTGGQIARLQQETRPCILTPPVDHYELTLATSSIACLPTAITVTACADTSSPCTNKVLTIPGQTASLATTAGTLGTGSVVFNASGDATTTLSHPGAGDGTVVTVTLSGESIAAANPRKCCPDGAGCVISNSCSTTFNTAGFIFSDTVGGGSVTPATQTAGVASSQLYLRAVRTSTTTKACESPLSGAATYPINFAYGCSNPSTCTGGSWLDVTPNPGAATAAPGSVAMPFDADGNAPFTFNYRDVGAITLSASATVNGASLSGSSSSFVVRPHNVIVSDVPGNPAASSATDAVFRRAGETFGLTITARNALNQATPNFREAVELASALVLPAAGNNPALVNATIAGTSFSSGAASVANVSWGEVGIITISPNVTDYLGTGAVAGTPSGNIGRFTPFDFSVSWNAPQFAPSCGGFTYLGQPFRYAPGMEPVLTATARNQAGATTGNYRGAFFKITNGSLTGKAYSAASGTLDVAAIGGTDPDVVDNSNGTATITFDSLTGSSAPAIAFVRPTTTPPAPVAAFAADISLSINVIDTDTVAYASNPARVGQATSGNGIAFASGNNQIRFGRLRLQNGLASSGTIALPIPVEVQYWDSAASTFRLNTADTCTTTLGSIALAPSLSGGSTSVQSATISAGAGAIRLAPPGAGNSGTVVVTPDVPAYLEGAWTGTAWTEDPSARGSWGVFGSQPRNFIYQRENFQ
ncbi:MAG TPA: DUF6701 domain-containing protein [Burkholderiales bacterium]|nr:DUF6701 domain-containing protein [Burkholderiales bacterium]